MDIESAIGVIMNCYGFDVESTPVGEAFAFILAALEAKDKRIKEQHQLLVDIDCLIHTNLDMSGNHTYSVSPNKDVIGRLKIYLSKEVIF